RSLVGDVDGDRERLAAELFERAHGGIGLRLVTRGHHHPGAGGGQPLGHAEADPPVAAGDDRDLACEIEHGVLRGASYPKSCDGTWWPSDGRPRTLRARTETTPSCRCAMPSMRRYGSDTSARRWRAKIGGVTITFAMPVSSSSERKTKPFA